jgi:hypothetical protein
MSAGRSHNTMRGPPATLEIVPTAFEIVPFGRPGFRRGERIEVVRRGVAP